MMRDGEVVGTKSPTGHSLLVDCRFELPFGKKDDQSLQCNSFISKYQSSKAMSLTWRMYRSQSGNFPVAKCSFHS